MAEGVHDFIGSVRAERVKTNEVIKSLTGSVDINGRSKPAIRVTGAGNFADITKALGVCCRGHWRKGIREGEYLQA
jgi:hypothetical protein